MGKDIKAENSHISPPNLFFTTAKYSSVAIVLCIRHEMRSVHHSYLLKL